VTHVCVCDFLYKRTMLTSEKRQDINYVELTEDWAGESLEGNV